MGEIVSIGVVASKRKETVQEAWDRFVAAQRRSKDTLAIEDGLEAAKAYRDFLELYARRA